MTATPAKRWKLPATDPQKRRKVIPQAKGSAVGAYCKSCQPSAALTPASRDTSAGNA